MKKYTDAEIKRICFLHGLKYHLDLYTGPVINETEIVKNIIPANIKSLYKDVCQYCVKYVLSLATEEEFLEFVSNVIPEGYIRFECYRQRRHFEKQNQKGE